MRSFLKTMFASMFGFIIGLFLLALWRARCSLILVDFSPVTARRTVTLEINVLVRRDGDITPLFIVPALWERAGADR